MDKSGRMWNLADGSGCGLEVYSPYLRTAWPVPASGSAERQAGNLTLPLSQSPAALAAVPPSC